MAGNTNMVKNSIVRINGEGTPRLIVIGDLLFESGTGTTYTSAGVTIVGGADLSQLQVGHRIRSAQVVNSIAEEVYGKVIGFDDDADTIVVDEWSGGVPTNGQKVYIDGFVLDLPRCQELTEFHRPDQLIHRLHRSRSESKHRGWLYRCVVDYSRYIAGDTLLDMIPALSLKETDRLVLITRKDVPEFQYNVHFEDEEIALSFFGRSIGYRKPVFVFVSEDPLASWPIEANYGANYANDYGNSL